MRSTLDLGGRRGGSLRGEISINCPGSHLNAPVRSLQQRSTVGSKKAEYGNERNDAPCRLPFVLSK